MTTATRTMIVPSASQVGSAHLVLVSDDGVWCSCPGYHYRGRCRHVNAIENEDGAQ